MGMLQDIFGKVIDGQDFRESHLIYYVMIYKIIYVCCHIKVMCLKVSLDELEEISFKPI